MLYCRSFDYRSNPRECLISNAEALVPAGRGPSRQSAGSAYYQKFCVEASAAAGCPEVVNQELQTVLKGVADLVIQANSFEDCVALCYGRRVAATPCLAGMYFIEVGKEWFAVCIAKSDHRIWTKVSKTINRFDWRKICFICAFVCNSCSSCRPPNVSLLAKILEATQSWKFHRPMKRSWNISKLVAVAGVTFLMLKTIFKFFNIQSSKFSRVSSFKAIVRTFFYIFRRFRLIANNFTFPLTAW